jgi:phenylacetic acid degradation operon negative regulatory protein
MVAYLASGMKRTGLDATAVTLGATDAARRTLARAKSHRLLVTLFGDYWAVGSDPLPSAGLVRVLEEFGIARTNARAALQRLTQRGVLRRTKDGRRTSYEPSESTVRVLERGRSRIFSHDDGLQWDGIWTLIAFSIPLEDGQLRRLLRARLRWLTFWPVFDATWATPHDRFEAAREQLHDLGISDALILRTTDVELFPGGRARLEAAWRLDELARAYLDYHERFAPLWERAVGGVVSPEEGLVARGELVDDWRLLVRDDPDLPLEFLPEDFPRRQSRQLFLETYEALTEPATTRFDELIRTSNGR